MEWAGKLSWTTVGDDVRRRQLNDGMYTAMSVRCVVASRRHRSTHYASRTYSWAENDVLLSQAGVNEPLLWLTKKHTSRWRLCSRSPFSPFPWRIRFLSVWMDFTKTQSPIIHKFRCHQIHVGLLLWKIKIFFLLHPNQIHLYVCCRHCQSKVR